MTETVISAQHRAPLASGTLWASSLTSAPQVAQLTRHCHGDITSAGTRKVCASPYLLLYRTTLSVRVDLNKVGPHRLIGTTVRCGRVGGNCVTEGEL